MPDLKHEKQPRASEANRGHNKTVDAYWDKILSDSSPSSEMRRSLAVGQFADRMKALCRVLAAWKKEPLLQPGDWCKGYGHNHSVRGSLVEWCNAMEYNVRIMREIATECPELREIMLDEDLLDMPIGMVQE
jgi:hypothetical protein